jgi:hypothetical protein
LPSLGVRRIVVRKLFTFQASSPKPLGQSIAFTLPEDDESKIREKVFDQIKLDDLKKDTGFNTLLEFLDKHLAKDDLADSLEKFEEFEENFSHFKLLLRNHWANWNQTSRNVPCMVLYKVSVFRSNRIFNMAPRANNML